MKIDLKVEKETRTEAGVVEKSDVVFEAHVWMNKDLFSTLVASALSTRLMPMSTTTEKAETKTPVA